MTTDLQRKRDEALHQINLDGGTDKFNRRDAEMAFRAGFLLAFEMAKQICAEDCQGDLDFAVFKLDALREQGEKEL